MQLTVKCSCYYHQIMLTLMGVNDGTYRLCSHKILIDKRRPTNYLEVIIQFCSYLAVYINARKRLISSLLFLSEAFLVHHWILAFLCYFLWVVLGYFSALVTFEWRIFSMIRIKFERNNDIKPT